MVSSADLIHRIDAMVTGLSDLLGNPGLPSSEYKSLDGFRASLQDLQGRLLQRQFDENSKKYQVAISQLDDAQKKLNQALEAVQKTAQVLEILGQVVTALEPLVV